MRLRKLLWAVFGVTIGALVEFQTRALLLRVKCKFCALPALFFFNLHDVKKTERRTKSKLRPNNAGHYDFEIYID